VHILLENIYVVKILFRWKPADRRSPCDQSTSSGGQRTGPQAVDARSHGKTKDPPWWCRRRVRPQETTTVWGL